MRIITAAAIILVLTLSSIPATLVAQTLSQNWPVRPVRLIVPLGAGSATDIVGRVYAAWLSKRWGKPVIVENCPGGDLMVGVASFTGAQDDHTLLLSLIAPIVVSPLTHARLPYDPADLLPISEASDVSVGIAVPTSLNVDTLDQLVALARSQPGKLNWAATPGGTYLTFAGFQRNANLPISNVSYRDIVQAQSDLGEARIHIMMCAIAIVLPQVQAGKVKLLAVVNRQRATSAPDVPTVVEAGYPELALEGAVGFFGGRGMPNDLRERISTDIRAVAADPDMASHLIGTGQIARGSTPAEFSELIEAQRARMAELAHVLDLKPMP